MVYLEIDLPQDVYNMLRDICELYEADTEEETTDDNMIAGMIRSVYEDKNEVTQEKLRVS